MNYEFQKNVVLEQMKEDLQQFTSDKLIRCPNCEKITEWDDINYNPQENEYTCPKCRKTQDETEYEVVNVVDYIEDMYLNYTVSKNDKGENYEINIK